MNGLLKVITVTVLVICVCGKDKEAKQGGITLKVLGQSGKISIRQDKPRKKSMTLEFNDLTEVDSAGSAVGCSGHSYRKFPNNDFTFMPEDKTEEVDFQNISASYFNFTSALRAESTLTAHMYIFKESGTYTVKDEEFSVERGVVKMSIEIQDWQFCGTGAGEDSNMKKGNAGAAIVLKVVIKGKQGGKPRKRKDGEKKKNGKKKNKKVLEFDFGDDMDLDLSSKVVIDGRMKEMTTGPSLEALGSKSVLTFKFPKGKNIVYDPTFHVADPSGYSPENSAPTLTAFSALFMIMPLLATKLL